MRLIDADELKQAALGLGEDVVCDDCTIEFITLIDAQPTIDELGKRNEPVTPVREIGSYSQIFRCRNCDALMVFQKQKYCHECGQAVKWNE